MQINKKTLANAPFSLFYLLFSVLIYTPVLVLYLHQEQKPVLLSALIISVIICFISIVVVVGIALSSQRAATIIDIILGPVALYVLVSVNIYPYQSGILDGKDLHLNIMSFAGHVLLLIACYCIFLIFRNSAKRALHAIGIFSVIFACYALIVLPVAPEVDNAHLLKVGRANNVFIIVMDMFQGYFVGNYIVRNPDVAKKFDSFIYFNNAVSIAPYTTISTRYILTGSTPHNETGFTKDINNDDNLLSDAIENGYDTNYVSVTIPVTLPELHSYSSNSILEVKKIDYFIFAYKCLNRFYPEKFLPDIDIVPPLEFGWISKTNARDSFLWMANNLTKDKKIDKTFHYYHNIMTHQPIRFTATGEYSTSLTSDDIYGELEFAFNCLDSFINRLKFLGLYDSSTIVITGDHGYNILNEFSDKTLPPEAYYLRNHFAIKQKGQYDVALMIKPPHAMGRLQRTDTAATLSDLRKTVNELMAPGNSKKIPGINLLQRGLPTEREVTILSFTKEQFFNEDFDRFDNWKPLKTKIPISIW